MVPSIICLSDPTISGVVVRLCIPALGLSRLTPLAQSIAAPRKLHRERMDQNRRLAGDFHDEHPVLDSNSAGPDRRQRIQYLTV